MKKIKCVSVDDDRLILSILEGMISQYDDFELVGEYHKSLDATTGITKQKPDLLFLDILMPGLNGLEVLDVLDVKPLVVVISGKTELKPDVLKSPQVIDFLEKPLDPDRFKVAIEKARFTLNNR